MINEFPHITIHSLNIYEKVIVALISYKFLFIRYLFIKSIIMDQSQMQFEDEGRVLNKSTLAKLKFSSYKCIFIKALIKANFIIWKSTNPIRAQTIKSFFSHIGIIIRELQLLSLVLNEEEGSLNKFISNLLNLLMFNTVKLKLGTGDLFTNFSLIYTFFLIMCITAIAVQLHFKKSGLFTPFILCIKLITFSITHILMIPMLVNSIHYAFKNNDLNGQFLDSEVLKKFIFLLHFCIISFHVLVSNLFSYESDYLTYEPRSRPCSIITFKEESCVILACFLNQSLGNSYYNLVLIAISGYCFQEFLLQHPYYKKSENYLTAGLWMSVGVLSVLRLIEKFIGMNNQSLLCFAFLTPLSYLLLYHYISKIQNTLSSPLASPQSFEHHLRYFLYHKRDLFEEDIEKIESLFESGSKSFLEFDMMSIWECNFIMQIKENPSLALIKLNKMIFKRSRPKSFEKPEKVFNYPFSLESSFFLYSLSKKLKKSDSFKDVLLIKYLKDLNYFKELDAIGCYRLMDVIDFFLLGNSVKFDKVNEKYVKLLKIIQLKDKLFEKSIKKYGNDQNFGEMNQSFKYDLVWNFDGGSSMNSMRTREFFLERLTGNKNIMNVATLILSGNPGSFCDVIHANDILLSLLKYPEERSIVGINFKAFFHEVFDDHVDRFHSHLLLSNQITFGIDQLFLIDYYGYTVEAGLEVRITCLKGFYYFIIYVHQLNSFLNYVLIDELGAVVTCSEKLKNIFTGYHKMIDDILPGFMKLLKTEPEFHQFNYTSPTGQFLFQYNTVNAKNSKIFAVYTTEQDRSLNFYSNASRKTSLGRRKSLTFSGKMIDDVFEFRKSVSSKRKNRLSEIYKRPGHRYVDKSININKYTKMMKYGNIIAFCSLLAIYFGIIIFHTKFDLSRFAEVLYNICTIRNNIATTVTAVRSIDLLMQGYSCGNDFSAYLETLKKNLNETEIWLKNITNYESEFSSKSLFNSPELTVYFYYSKSPIAKTQALFDSIYEYSENLNQLISSNFSDHDIILYIYKNGFFSFQDLLNQTAYKSFLMITQIALDTFVPVQLMNVITLVPFSVIFLGSLIFLHRLQKINFQLNDIINSIPDKTLVLMRSKINDRIKKLHDSNFSKEYDLNQMISVRNTIWRKYLIFITAFIFFVLAFCFINEYVINRGYYQIIENRLNYRFFGGLRTTSSRSFLWARENALRKIGIGYLDMFEEFNEIGDEKMFSKLALEQLHYLNSNGLRVSQTLNQRFDFSSFFKILIGNPCNLILSGNCSSSFLRYGLYKASEILSRDIENFNELNEFDGDALVELERRVKYFTSNAGILFEEFDKCVNDVNSHRELTLGLLCLMIFFVISYYLVFINRELNKIKYTLLSRNVFLKFYEPDKRGV